SRFFVEPFVMRPARGRRDSSGKRRKQAVWRRHCRRARTKCLRDRRGPAASAAYVPGRTSRRPSASNDLMVPLRGHAGGCGTNCGHRTPPGGRKKRQRKKGEPDAARARILSGQNCHWQYPLDTSARLQPVCRCVCGAAGDVAIFSAPAARPVVPFNGGSMGTQLAKRRLRCPHKECAMTDINDVQAAMRLWHEAHTAVMDFYEAHNVLEPARYEEWMVLRRVEDDVRRQADILIERARSELPA